MYTHTEEAKNKIRAFAMGRKPALGKHWKLSAETKKKQSVAQKKLGKRWEGKQHPKGMLGKKTSIKTRKKLSDALKGSKSYLWRGGITEANYRIRHSLEYKLWREAVFERDKYTCIWCGAKSGVGKKVILQADHIKPFALYPELRFAIDNGRTLCKSCHKTTNTYGYNYVKNYIIK